MDSESPQQDVPAELQHCPPTALEGYVRRRIQSFNDQLELAQWLGPEAAAALSTATRELLAAAEAAEGGSGVASSGAGGAPGLQLVFRHDCRHLGCADAHCLLCSQNQARRCPSNFCSKYLSGDVLKAACGAGIRVELVDRATGRLVPNHDAIQLQVCILDGRAYQELGASGAPGDADLDRITLSANQQGQPLLSAAKAAVGSDGRLLVPMTGGSAQLPDLSITGSSEALLSGLKPPFVLLARAVEAGSGQRRADIPPVASEGFVVATPRVRTASKKDIPHLSDPVSKIACVGAATQAKLRDLPKAAATAGVQGLELPLHAVTTVGEFRQLVVWAQEDAGRCEQVRRMLKLAKGWEEARDHALRAVGTDNRLRAFFTDDSRTAGLLFACQGAAPLLDAPLATLQAAADGSGQPSLLAMLLAADTSLGAGQSLGAKSGSGMGQAVEGQQVQARTMLRQAKACWARRGHPGWAVLPLDSGDFERQSLHLQQVMLPTLASAAAVPPVPHSGGSSSLRSLPQQPTLQGELVQAAGQQPQAPFAGRAATAASLPGPGGLVRAAPLPGPSPLAAWQLSSGLPSGLPISPFQADHPPLLPDPPPAGLAPAMPAAATGLHGSMGGGSLQAGIGAAGGSLTTKLLHSFAPLEGQQGALSGSTIPAAVPLHLPAGSTHPAAVPLHLQAGSMPPVLSADAISARLGFPSSAYGSNEPPLSAAAADLHASGTAAWSLPGSPLAAEPAVPITPPPLGGAGKGLSQQGAQLAEASAPQGPRAGAGLAAAEQPAAGEAVPTTRSGAVDWAALLLEAYRPEGTGARLPAVKEAGAGGTERLHPNRISAEQLGPLFNAFSHASAAAQEFAKLGTLANADWETVLASLDSLPLFPPGDTLLPLAGAGGGPGPNGPGPVPDIWSRLLSLSPSDLAAAMNGLHGGQQAQQAQQESGAGAGAGSDGQATAPEPAGAEQQQQQQQPPPPQGLQHQPQGGSGKGERKRTLSKLSPVSSGLEEMMRRPGSA